MNRLLLPMLSAVLLLSGCHTMAVRCASDAEDAAAKTFQPMPGKALVYFYLNDHWAGPLQDCSNIIVDRKRVGVVAFERFCIVALPPGDHEFGVTSSATDSIYFAPQDVTLQADSIYYMKQEWIVAYGPRLAPAAPQDAQSRIMASHLSAGPTALQDMHVRGSVILMPYTRYPQKP